MEWWVVPSASRMWRRRRNLRRRLLDLRYRSRCSQRKRRKRKAMRRAARRRNAAEVPILSGGDVRPAHRLQQVRRIDELEREVAALRAELHRNNRKIVKNASNRHRPQSDACRERRAWRAVDFGGYENRTFYAFVPAFVQTDKNDGKDYRGLERLSAVRPGRRADRRTIRWMVVCWLRVIPSKVYGWRRIMSSRAVRGCGRSARIIAMPEDMVMPPPSTSVIGPDDPIVIPPCSNDMNSSTGVGCGDGSYRQECAGGAGHGLYCWVSVRE